MVYEKPTAPPVTRKLQRWVNNKWLFRAVLDFNDFDPTGWENGKTTGSEEFMTKERIEKELSKVDAQLDSLQEKKKDLEEQKRMAERAEKMDIIEKHKISSEKLQLLIKFSEDEILKLLEEKENAKEMAGNEEKVIS